MDKLFITKKIKVGFQNRDDTYSGKLAYIIYYDSKGVLRKEHSWENWRDKEIAPEEFENVPTTGFSINKDVKRYDWSHFSSNRTLIRIYDPRGFEFEITTDNLILILMHSDCTKRYLQGDYVYAWYGAELILLPTNSEEYKRSVEHTKLLGSKVSAKTLVAGYSYKGKNGSDFTYIGRYPYYYWGVDKYTTRTEKKCHIFHDGKAFIPKSSVEFLAECNGNQIVNNFAELIDQYKENVFANKIFYFELIPTKLNLDLELRYGRLTFPERKTYFAIEKDDVYVVEPQIIGDKDFYFWAGKRLDFAKQQVARAYSDLGRGYNRIIVKNRIAVPNTYWHWENRIRYKDEYFNKEEFANYPIFDIYVTFENGTKKKIDFYNDIDLH